MNQILMLVEDYFRDEEVIYPYYRLQEAGFEVITVGPKKGQQYYGKFGIPVTADISVQEADASQASAIIVPGGNAPDKMRINHGMVKLIQDAYRQQKVIAAICHGGWMLVEADILKGKKVTGYIAIATDLKNAGANYLDQEVVIDGNIITSRKPDDLPAFCRAIIDLTG